jgi:hypothetical protein
MVLLREHQTPLDAATALAKEWADQPKLLAELIRFLLLAVFSEFVTTDQAHSSMFKELAEQLVSQPENLARVMRALREHRLPIDVASTLAREWAGQPGPLGKLLTALEAIADEPPRDDILADTLVRLDIGELPEELKRLAKALRTTEIPDEITRSFALTAVGEQSVSEEWEVSNVSSLLLEKFESDADKKESRQHRNKLLGALGQHLSDETEVLIRALAAAERIGDGSARAAAYGALVGQLQDERKRKAQVWFLAEAQANHDDLSRALLLSDAAREVTAGSDFSREMFETVKTLRQEVWQHYRFGNVCPRSLVLQAIVRKIPDEPALLEDALTVAAAIEHEWRRAEALSAVAARLAGKPDLLSKAVQEAVRISDERPRALFLSILVGQLAGEQQLLDRALALSGTRDNTSRVLTLTALARQLQGKPRRVILAEALVAGEAIEDGYLRTLSLCAIAAQLRGKYKQEVLEKAQAAAEAVGGEDSDLHRIASCVVQNTKQRPSNARSTARRRAMLNKALTAVEEDEFETPFLWGETGPIRLARAFSALAPHLRGHPELELRCLKSALESLDGKWRIIVTALLTRGNPSLLDYSLWTDWLAGTPRNRSDLLRVIPDLAAAAAQLTGRPEEVWETTQAVRDVARWWP